MEQELRQRLRETLTAILGGFVYRNAGEMPHYEEPITSMLHALGWDNLEPEQNELYTQIILAIFDGRDYPQRGTFPHFESIIHQTMDNLYQAFDANVNRIRGLYPIH